MLRYESLFGGFIWSHIKLQELTPFLNTINGLVEKDGTVVFMDNNYVEGSNLPITSRDEQGNTYQTRLLGNGTSHQIIKNFPTESFIRDTLSDKASEIEFIHLPYYWILKYKPV
jgi:demethylmenaquinone methyltransferase/2-methoxy-6-polyprenyl-1,4-benzoquinol methylase